MSRQSKSVNSFRTAEEQKREDELLDEREDISNEDSSNASEHEQQDEAGFLARSMRI